MYQPSRNLLYTLATALILLLPAALYAAGDISGWEVDSEYNKHYNPKERDDIKGDIVKFITVKPLKGMAPGTAFILDEGGGDEVVGHVCPESYASGR